MKTSIDEDITPPFGALDYGEHGVGIVDSNGRTLMFEIRHGAFVRELVEIMNENKERLVKAWQKRRK